MFMLHYAMEVCRCPIFCLFSSSKLAGFQPIFKLFMKRILASTFFVLSVFSATATDITVSNRYTYHSKSPAKGLSSNGTYVYYYNGRTVLNQLNTSVLHAKWDIIDIKMNPTGSSVCALSSNGESRHMDSNFGFSYNFKPLAICYSPDARYFASSDTDGQIHVFSVKGRTLQEERKISSGFNATQLEISGNRWYVAAVSGNEVGVFDFEGGAIRNSASFGSPIHQISFSKDNLFLYVLLENAELYKYRLADFSLMRKWDSLGKASSFSVSSDGKYVTVAVSDREIRFINSLDGRASDVTVTEDGLDRISFVTARNGREYIVYNSKDEIKVSLVNNLEPYYYRLVNEEVESRMHEWMERMPEESLEEYNARVTSESYAERKFSLEREIATRLVEGDGLVNLSDIRLGNYDMDSHMLAVFVGDMPPVYLNISEKELAGYKEDDFLLVNPQYVINENDDLELVYVEMHNRNTGSISLFDNRERRSLDYLKLSDSFVPIELIQKSTMQEVGLKDIKNDVLQEAKRNDILSDHTNIFVDAAIKKDIDRNGHQIYNYVVSYSYDVESEFSAHDDYGSGKYAIEESPAAMAMAAIIRKSFESELADYVNSNKDVLVEITGSADRSPIRGKIAYDGRYGEFLDQPVSDNGSMFSVSVTTKDGITDNDQLAFIRAAGFCDYIGKEIRVLNSMKKEVKYNTEVFSREGAEFRRVKIVFTFYDILND